MSEMIVTECDHGDGECLTRHEGFVLNTTQNYRDEYLESEGWGMVDDKHYCPDHNPNSRTATAAV